MRLLLAALCVLGCSTADTAVDATVADVPLTDVPLTDVPVAEVTDPFPIEISEFDGPLDCIAACTRMAACSISYAGGDFCLTTLDECRWGCGNGEFISAGHPIFQCLATMACEAGAFAQCFQEGEHLQCEVDPLVAGVPAPADDGDLQCQGDPCRRNGLCSFVDGSCRASVNDDCKQAWLCQEMGFCTAEMGRCVAGSDADCQSARDCAWNGYCSMADGWCVPKTDADCADTYACSQWGRCKANGRICVAGSDAGCEASSVSCALYGRCTAGEELCVAKDNAACVASRHCKEAGWCTNLEGFCGAASDMDCRDSLGCTDHGRCTAHAFRYCYASK
ncbi:MAG: hypothetical protein ACI9OJ_005023 [Myxococcota bacterium]|jgi:hypothetical protein